MLNTTEFRGQPCVELSLPSGERVRIALHGAHVLSWTTADGAERLYLSPDALIDGSSPIRGGVPVCFPQFNQRTLGTAKLPKHGFARTAMWSVGDATDGNGDAKVSLSLRPDAALRAIWPFEFTLTLTVKLSPSRLRVVVDVVNTGDVAWPFSLALHTYLKVDDISRSSLDGLGGLTFWDGVRDLKTPDARRQQPPGALTFDGEIDRIYAGASGALAVTHPGGSVAVTQSESLQDVVVWNPGEALSAALPDMPADGYRHMLCVEAACINTPVLLPAGQAWHGWQELGVLA